MTSQILHCPPLLKWVHSNNMLLIDCVQVWCALGLAWQSYRAGATLEMMRQR